MWQFWRSWIDRRRRKWEPPSGGLVLYDLTIPDVEFNANFPLFESIERNPAPMANDPLRYYRGLTQACERVLGQLITADTDLAALNAPFCWKCDCAMQHFASIGPQPTLVVELAMPGIWKQHGWRCEACGVALNWTHQVKEQA